MTKERFEAAKMLERRIDSMNLLLKFISEDGYSLSPPTRQSRYTIHKTADASIVLNEAEVTFLREALVKERDRLQGEFELL